jgi:hypothetical protein
LQIYEARRSCGLTWNNCSSDAGARLLLALGVKGPEADPVRRFQNPTELLKAMPMIIGVVDAERTITCESLRMAPADLYAVPHKPPARLGPERISVARLPIQEAMFLGERRTSLC